MTRSKENKSTYLTADEAAEVLGMSPRTLAKWRSKEFGPPFYRFSRRNVRYGFGDLMNWLQAQRVKTNQAGERT